MANNPKLEIAAGETAIVEFENREPHEGQGNYGPWFLWTVTVEGSEYSLFAGEAPSKTSPSFDQIDKALEESPRVSIANMGDKVWTVEADGGGAPPAPSPMDSALPPGAPSATEFNKRRQAAEEPPPPDAKSTSAATPPAWATSTARSRESSYQDVVGLLGRNMADARKVVAEFGKGLDGDTVGAVERMAIFLAIHCDKKGITLDDIKSNDELPF